jgi:hypothetical protein
MLIAFLGAGGSPGYAALDPGFSYQGELRLSGTLVDGDHDFRFRLYDLASGGTAVGPTISLTNVPVADGVFSVFLDFGTAPLASQPRFLEIDVRSAGAGTYQTLAPRTRLSTTPYALAAAVALEGSVDSDSIVAGSVGSAEIDSGEVQRRVANACPSGEFVRQIEEDGTAVCASAGGAGSGWSLSGNAGTNSSTNFLGTTDDEALVLRSNNEPVARFEVVALPAPGEFTGNIVMGSPDNFLQPGVRGATVSGGGVPGADPGTFANPNRVHDNFGTVGGGQDNEAGNNDGNVGNAPWATVGGGVDNLAGGEASTVGGGKTNQILGDNSTVAGGFENFVTDNEATIGGGVGNRATAVGSTIAGGFGNFAGGFDSAIAGGVFNSATGNAGFVSGGLENCAGGNASWAGGQRAKVRPAFPGGGDDFGCFGVPLGTPGTGDEGTFVWADSQNADFISTGSDQFLVRAAGGIYLGANSSPSIPSGRFINTSTGAFLSTGGVWTNSSSRALKAGFEAVEPATILSRLLELPLTRWVYKASPGEGMHLGPMAEDFHAAFGLGASAETISTVDASGVALAAIQGLNQRLEAENQALREENDVQDAAIADLRRELQALRARIEDDDGGP